MFRSKPKSDNRHSLWRNLNLPNLLSGAHVLAATLSGTCIEVSAETLLEAINLAKENSVELRKQVSVISDREAEISIARSALQPDVYLEVGGGLYSQRDHHGSTYIQGATTGSHNFARFSVQQNLYDGNKRENNLQAAQMANLAETVRLEHLEQQVLMRAVKAFFNVRHDRAMLTHAKKNLGLLKNLVALELQRYDLGESTLTDLSQIRAYSRRIEIDFQIARSKLDASSSAFRKYIGAAVPRKLTAAFIGSRLPGNLAQAITIARRQHPLLAVDDYLIAEAAYLTEAERAEIYPTLSINGSYAKGDRIRSRYNETASIDLRLTIPLSNKKRVTNRIAQSQELRYRRQLDRQKHSQEIAESVTVIFKAMHTARLNSKSASAAAKEARLSFDYAVEERKYGLISTPELLEIHRYLCEAERIKLDQERATRIAEFALLSSIGRLNPAWLQDHRKASPTIRLNDAKPIYRVEIENAVGTLGNNTDHWSGMRKSVIAIAHRSTYRKNRLLHRDNNPR